MKKYLKYPLSLISPVLAYYAYTGNIGASNLLVGWTVFGLSVSVFASAFILLAITAKDFFPKGEKTGEKLNLLKPEFQKVQGFTFGTCVDIMIVVFYVWCGWWGLAAMEAFQCLALKSAIFCFINAKFHD